MYIISQLDVSVRPELESMSAYLPGESLVAFSARTGIPVHHIIKLNSNESPYGPVPSVIKALGDCKNYNHYPDSDAITLRAALSDYTGLDGSHIVLSHGSNELINLLWHIFLSVGDTILCCPPTFSLYTTVTSFCGASVIEVPRTSDFEIDVEDVLAALTPSTKLIVICSPNNPTGNPIAESDVLALLESGRIVVTRRGLCRIFPAIQVDLRILCRTTATWLFYALSANGQDWQVCALDMAYSLYGSQTTCYRHNVHSKSILQATLPQLRH